jgi:hypothetical protein
MNCGLGFYQSLRSISVVNIPVDYQHTLGTVSRACVVSCGRNVTEDAESHRSRRQSVMTGRPNGAERTAVALLHDVVDGRKSAAGTGGRRIPRARARDGVDVELPSPGGRDSLDLTDIARSVDELELGRSRVSSLDLLDSIEESGIVTQGASDGTEASNVLGMIPSGVVTAAIRMRNEGDRHAA